MTRIPRRLAAAACAALAALALPLVAPSIASADDPASGEPGYSADPFYFAPDELPKGIPFDLSHSAVAKMTVADLVSGPPTCAAPAPLPATEAGSADGYTVPVRIKLTNGIMLTGYSAAADHYGQKIPFALRVSGLTGWVDARIQLPSMNVLLDPSDVHFCDGATIAVVDIAGGFVQPPDWGQWDLCADPTVTIEVCGTWQGSGLWPQFTQPDDGSAFIPYPGTIAGSNTTSGSTGYLFGAPGGASRLDLRDVVAKIVDAEVTGLGADGSVELSVALKLTTTVANVNANDNSVLATFPMDLDGTFSTAAKTAVTPRLPAELPWVQRVPEVPSYLPTRTLAGAVEGRTATVGSNRIDFDNTRLNASSGNGRVMAASIAPMMVGTDKYGATLLSDWPWQENFTPYIDSVVNGSSPFPEIPRGAADVSMDMTIDSIGLPHGLPAGYGWGS